MFMKKKKKPKDDKYPINLLKQWKNKGQLSIDNSLSWIILVVISAVLTPLARSFINDAIAGTNNTGEIIALQALLPVYWIVVLGVIVMYAHPQQSNY